MDLYIYYRVRIENEARFRDQAQAMQQSILQECGIVAELKRRPDAKDGKHTWMEVYHTVPENFDAVLAKAVSDAGLPALIDGERHIELFLDCSPCV